MTTEDAPEKLSNAELLNAYPVEVVAKYAMGTGMVVGLIVGVVFGWLLL